MDESKREAINILLLVREKITDHSDLMWTSYETAEELREEIDKCIAGLRRNDKPILDEINYHFSPAASFQEHSLQNGWSDEYQKLAARFDELYKKLK